MENRIASIRRAKKIRQNDMARSLGVTPSYLCRVERNEHEPSEQFVKSCAEFLQTTVEDILRDEKISAPQSSLNKLWECRTKRNIKQRDLAKTLKCSPSYLSRIEKGELDPPAEFKKECAKALGSRVQKIFSGDMER